MRDTCLRIVDLLSDGEFVSGAVLGQVLGVSRTAVWKQLNIFQFSVGIVTPVHLFHRK